MRTRPLVVSTRLDYGQRSRLERVATELSTAREPVTIADVLRSAVESIGLREYDTAAQALGMRSTSDETPVTEADRTALCKFLGIPADATDKEITSAVEALLVTAEPPAPAGATGGNADQPPAPTPNGFKRSLTRNELAYCTRHKLTPAEFEKTHARTNQEEMNMSNPKQPKSELDRARRTYRQAADAYERRRSGSAENPMRAPGQANPELDEAELAMLDAEIALKHAEAQAATGDPEVQALARWLADALEQQCKPALEVAPPAPPVLASFAPDALTAHADALAEYNAKLPDVQKAAARAVARVQSVWRTALAGQALLQASRKAAGSPAPRLLVTSEGLPGKGRGAALGVPYTPDAIDDVAAALRDAEVIADTSAIESRRDRLAHLIDERAAADSVAAELATMTPGQIAFESNWGHGSAREDHP